MQNKISALSSITFIATFCVSIARAGDTGLIGIHNLNRYGRYVCTASHEHIGTGAQRKNKKLALRSAIRNWKEFTTWEYGSDWGKWRYARAKAVNCKGKKGAIECTVIARPCKPRGKFRRNRRN